MREDEYQRVFETEASHWWYVGGRELLEHDLMSFAPNRASNQLLDAGCGTGGNLTSLARLGTTVGIDLSETALSLARKRNPDHLVCGSVSNLPFRSNSFDVITCVDVLYHQWVNDEPALKELERVLRPGGILIVQAAALEFLRGHHDSVVLTRERYRKNTLKRRLKNAGFRIVRLTYRNTFLLPLIFLKRFLQRGSLEIQSDLRMPSPVINTALKMILSLENVLLRYMTLPVGSSLYAVAQKPEKG